jgi:nitroreductase
MEFDEVIRKRRMVRAFTQDPVHPAVVERLLTAANRAPSAGFSQGYALLTLAGPDQLGPFWEILAALDNDGSLSPAADPPRSAPPRNAALRNAALRNAPPRNAPLVIVPLSCKDIYLERYARQDKGWTDRDEAHWPVPYWDIDTGFTALLMLLTAVDEGLGALFFGIPPELIGRFRAQYGVPEQYLPIGAVAVGHPDPAADEGGSSRVIRRRSLDDLVHRGRW